MGTAKILAIIKGKSNKKKTKSNKFKVVFLSLINNFYRTETFEFSLCDDNKLVLVKRDKQIQ